MPVQSSRPPPSLLDFIKVEEPKKRGKKGKRPSQASGCSSDAQAAAENAVQSQRSEAKFYRKSGASLISALDVTDKLIDDVSEQLATSKVDPVAVTAKLAADR